MHVIGGCCANFPEAFCFVKPKFTSAVLAKVDFLQTFFIFASADLDGEFG